MVSRDTTSAIQRGQGPLKWKLSRLNQTLAGLEKGKEAALRTTGVHAPLILDGSQQVDKRAQQARAEMALPESRRRVSHAWGRSTEMSRTEQVFEQTEKFESDAEAKAQ